MAESLSRWPMTALQPASTRAEHSAAAGILGVLPEECQQARHGRRTGQAGDDDIRLAGQTAT